MKLPLVILLFIAVASCEKDSVPSGTENSSGARCMTAVSEEMVIDSEPTMDENLDKAFDIVRSVCEGGFYSISCTSPNIVPPMKIDRENLVPVMLEVTQMAAKQPNYVFIRCDTEIDPPPTELVELCYRLVVEQASR